MERSKNTFGVLPNKMPGANKDTPSLVDLGKTLYLDKRLSKNNSQSCNSCHDIQAHGVDNLATSPGAFQKNGDRNSPTVFNAGFHIAQFWDGRAPDLKEQAKGPILNPIEMGMSSEKEVIDKLKKIEEYKLLFQRSFPNQKDPITYDNLAEAIAAFERTLITKDRFDLFQKGDHKALTKEEINGLEAFMNTGCITCHQGVLLGGNMYQKTGLVNPYKNAKDLGKYNVTKDDVDKYVFKVPSLRNIKNTAPYFHDGKVKTLKEAVNEMAWIQLGRRLKPETTDVIVAFLQSLSHTENLQK